MSDALLPLRVVAAHCGVSVETVRVWCREERIEYAVLPNGHYRVKKSTLEKISTGNNWKRPESVVAGLGTA